MEQTRLPHEKAFSFQHKELGSKSLNIKYNEDPVFKGSKDAFSMCIVYATAYTETMLTRAKLEDPEVFAMKGLSKGEMQKHLVHNMCLPYK